MVEARENLCLSLEAGEPIRIRGKRLLVFFVITLQSRRVTIAGIHPQPYGAWMEQMARNLTDPVDGCLRRARYLIHDRDPLYTRVFGEILEGGGVQPIRLPPKSPNLNAYAERFVRSIKEECLSRVVPLARGTCVSSCASTSNTTIASETIRDSTTSSCNDRPRRVARTRTFGDVSVSVDYSSSTIGKLHEWSAD